MATSSGLIVDQDLAHAALQHAHRLASDGRDEPPGDGAGIVQPLEVIERAQPCGLHDILDVRGAQPVALGHGVEDAVEACHEVIPRALVAGRRRTRQM
jgi:hypothetical protein